MKLKEARLKQNLSQEELAKEIGVTQGLLSHWETGLMNPSEINRSKMDKLLNNKVDFISEFDPLDTFEQKAALELAHNITVQVSSDAAARLVFENTKYDLRKLLKAHKLLPHDYQTGDDILLPIEFMERGSK